MTVVSASIWVATRPARDEAKARADLRANVETRQQRLGRAGADGVLHDAEIVQLFPPEKPAKGLIDIKRQGKTVTVIAEMLGLAPPGAFILMYQTTVEGCYAFHIPPPAHGAPRVSVRQLPDKTCAVGAPSSAPRVTHRGEVPVR
ncbi:hypothetical protein [Streptomyces sp. PU_AKi4]|uniref:hypothetical protein n=1 Tax=Streptomyces sp. PU_AKi4 TaxID=2800809 RepID=UPI003525C77D